MTAIVEGFYKHGTIQLLEPPSSLPEGRVRVIVIPETRLESPRSYLTFGKYQSRPMSTLEDFKDAEWRGEEELHGQ
jgi:hypothetical protein